MKRMFPFLAVLLAATIPVAAQVPPAPGPAPAQGTDESPPPSPHPEPSRPGPRADAPPPPGASLQIEKGPDGRFRIDLHCNRTDTTRACADVAIELIDKLEPEAPAK